MKLKKYVFLLLATTIVGGTFVYGSDALERVIEKAIDREYEEVDRQRDRMDQAYRNYEDAMTRNAQERLARQRHSSINNCVFGVTIIALVTLYVKSRNAPTVKKHNRDHTKEDSDLKERR